MAAVDTHCNFEEYWKGVEVGNLSEFVVAVSVGIVVTER